MKEWYTNAELAALKLPAFPATKPGVDAWMKAEDIDARHPRKVRRRAGRGGGRERHYTVLPKSLQALLTVRHLKTAEAPPLEAAFAGERELAAPEATARGHLRRDAILTILGLWDIFRAKFAGPTETARHHFVTMYRTGRLEGLPEWARDAMKTRAGRPKGLSVNTLRDWETKRADGRLGALAGAWGNRRGTGVLERADDGKVATLIGALLVKQPHLTADQVRDQVRGAFGETLTWVSAATGAIECRPMPPARAFRRFISRWKAEHAEALMKLTDPDGFRNTLRIAGRDMNHWVRRPNQLWEIDASPADALTLDGRYAVYAVTDIFTRRMLVHFCRTPRTEAVLALLRKAILAWGVPEIIRTDNGSDFTSRWAVSAIAGLGIKTDVTAPFSPEQKGTVERAIGTLQRGLMPLLPGFVGHSVADRKTIEARKAFAQRLGESDEKAFCVELTADELQAYADDWCEWKYGRAPHAGLKGRSPFEVLAAYTGTIRRVESERALDLFLAPIAGRDGFRTVTKTGIPLDGGRFLHPSLIPGTRVFCRQDPADMGRAVVYAEDQVTFLCVAECPERLGADPGAAVRAAREAQKARIEAEVRPLEREIRRIKPRDMIERAIRVAKAEHGTVIALPKRAENHTSPGLEGAAEAARAMDGEAPARTREPAAPVVARLERIEPQKTMIQEKRERWARCQEIDGRLAAEEPVDDADAAWLMRYLTTAEYRGFAMVFGPVTTDLLRQQMR